MARRPRESTRSVGRWRDDIRRHAGKNLILTDQQRITRKTKEEAYVQEWASTGFRKKMKKEKGKRSLYN